jgi:hypothetical protein
VNQLWTIVRFPNGSWSGGGSISDSAYDQCEKWQVRAASYTKALKAAQGLRARARKKANLPSVRKAALPVTTIEWRTDFDAIPLRQDCLGVFENEDGSEAVDVFERTMIGGTFYYRQPAAEPTTRVPHETLKLWHPWPSAPRR